MIVELGESWPRTLKSNTQKNVYEFRTYKKIEVNFFEHFKIDGVCLFKVQQRKFHSQSEGSGFGVLDESGETI